MIPNDRPLGGYIIRAASQVSVGVYSNRNSQYGTPKMAYVEPEIATEGRLSLLPCCPDTMSAVVRIPVDRGYERTVM